MNTALARALGRWNGHMGRLPQSAGRRRYFIILTISLMGRLGLRDIDARWRSLGTTGRITASRYAFIF